MTREELVAICEAASVHEGEWFNRDTAEAQKQMGQCWAWLKAGCAFQVHPTRDEAEEEVNLPSDEKTLWVTVWAEGFQFHELHEPGDPLRAYMDEETFYLPTRATLKRASGKDWYSA